MKIILDKNYPFYLLEGYNNSGYKNAVTLIGLFPSVTHDIKFTWLKDNETIYHNFCIDCPLYKSNKEGLIEYIDNHYSDDYPTNIGRIIKDIDYQSEIEEYKEWLNDELLKVISNYFDNEVSTCEGIYHTSLYNCVEDHKYLHSTHEMTAKFQPHALGVSFLKNKEGQFARFEMSFLYWKEFSNKEGYIFAPYRFTNIWGIDVTNFVRYGQVCAGTSSISLYELNNCEEVEFLDFYTSFFDSYFNMDLYVNYDEDDEDSKVFNYSNIKELIEEPYEGLYDVVTSDYSKDTIDDGYNFFALGTNHMKLVSDYIEV